MRMRRVLAELDYGPLLEQVEATGRAPVMLTLTSPGDWLAAFPTSRHWVAAVDRFRKRWFRQFGVGLVGPWKQEFQERGAPHRHLLVPEYEIEPRRGCRVCGEYGRGTITEGGRKSRAKGRTCDSFRHWVSEAWADSVASQRDRAWWRSWVASGEYRKHLLAGTGVDRDRRNTGSMMVDPRRLATYFLKHSMGAAKEYQNQPPAVWVGSEPVELTAESPVEDLADDAGEWLLQPGEWVLQDDGAEWVREEVPGESCGRFWGYHGLRRHRRTVAVTRREYHFVNRTLRRLRRSRDRAWIHSAERLAVDPSSYHDGRCSCGCTWSTGPDAFVSRAGAVLLRPPVRWSRRFPSHAQRESGRWHAFADAPAALSAIVAYMREGPPD